jgi:membrane protease YdiL (CAAX protease family)
MRAILIRPADGRVRAGWRYALFSLALALAGLAGSGVRHALDLPAMRGADGVLRPGTLLTRGVLTMALTLGVTALFLRFVERRPLSTVGLPLRGPWVRGFLVGLLFGAAPVALLVGVLAASGHASVALALPTARDLVWLWLPTAVGFALVSSMEELMLRGYGLQLLAEARGRWFAALVTGAFFGAMHAGNPGANVLGIVNTATLAVLLAWLVLRTGSLWIAFGYHSGWNLAGAPVFGMRLSGLDVPSALLRTRLTGPEWVTGGSYGFEGSALIGLIELAVLATAVALAPRLPGQPELRRYFGARDRDNPSGGESLAAPGSSDDSAPDAAPPTAGVV